MTVINLAIALISVVASVITIALFWRALQEHSRCSWRRVEHLIRRLLAEMNKEDYVPDIVIGVGRGGGIVAGILAGNLGYVPYFVVDTILDRSQRVSSARVRYEHCCPDLAGKSILLVVGELYSGEDLRVAVKYVEDRHAGEIRTLSLFTHPAASIRPHYVGAETKQPLRAPWRMTETYKARRL